jgi:hypothetical protein
MGRVILLAFAMLSVSSCGSDGLVCSESFAYGAAKSIMEKRLASPGSAKFASLSDPSVTVKKTGACEYHVESYVDSQNGFGALLRTRFTITVTGVAEEKYWQGSELKTL